ncbi:hypothetical protein WR25_20662 [Diploscapter pachys]|uniref:Uncharacterized protein n=1 Tax=Diploscapter pachys TaxID=2018661 RepID=A0A2A2L2M0_9BILA|nr:hypothetical protein WR25_20662 [Diploscapter pachys]
MFVLEKKDVPSLVVIPYSDPYNVLLFNKGDQSLVWITFADDSSIDAGYSFAFSGKQMAASGVQTYGDFGFSLYTAPINWENGTISRTFEAKDRDSSSYDFPWTFGNVDACKPGPFNIITTSSNSFYEYPYHIDTIITVPGFCFIRDSDSDGKNGNHIF